MDKALKYKKLIRDMLTEMASRFRNNSNWEILEAYDDEHGQYLLFTDGWKADSRDYGCFMHLEVKPDGKIWIRRDGTDFDMGSMLLEEGITKQEIVLGFRSPWLRAMSDFAES
jgi:hypothetical protein